MANGLQSLSTSLSKALNCHKVSRHPESWIAQAAQRPGEDRWVVFRPCWRNRWSLQKRCHWNADNCVAADATTPAVCLKGRTLGCSHFHRKWVFQNKDCMHKWQVLKVSDTISSLYHLSSADEETDAQLNSTGQVTQLGTETTEETSFNARLMLLNANVI